MPFPEQPAIKSYFFGKGYRDLWATIVEGWSLNLDSLRTWTTRAGGQFSEGGWKLLSGVLCLWAGICVLVFGTVFFAIACAAHITILAALLAAVYLIFTSFYLTERLVMLIYRVFVACPHCHRAFDIPVYTCPNCGEKHNRLVPSSYGIFLRTCKCDHKLVTSFFTGRKRYKASCPHEDCGRTIDHAETTPFCIPVIGTPKAGKTCFVFSATDSVAARVAPSLGWQAVPADEGTRTSLDAQRSEAAAGRYPLKTSSHHAQAHTLKFNTGSRIAQLLYLYDSAGEVFTGGDSLDTHYYYGYSHGFVVLVDAPGVLNSGRGAFNSASDTEDAFSRMLNKFRKNHDVKAGARVNRPMAIILNKIDSPELRSEFGDDIFNPASINGERCERFLVKHGGHNFIELARGSFQNVRFFAASALTRERHSLESKGVDEVMRWLIDETRLGKHVRPRSYSAALYLLCVIAAIGGLVGLAVHWISPSRQEPEVGVVSRGALPSHSPETQPAPGPPAPPRPSVVLPSAVTLEPPSAIEPEPVTPAPAPTDRAVSAPDPPLSEETLFGGAFSKISRRPAFEEKFGADVAEMIWPAGRFPAALTGVTDGGRAHRAGLRSDDQIEEIDGCLTRELDSQQLESVVAKALAKTSFTVFFYRWGEQNYVIHKLRRNRAEGNAWSIGMEVSHQLNECSFPKVTKVITNAPAERAGISRGDVIIAVNGHDLHLSLERNPRVLNPLTCGDEAKRQENTNVEKLMEKLSGSRASEVELIICPRRVAVVSR